MGTLLVNHDGRAARNISSEKSFYPKRSSDERIADISGKKYIENVKNNDGKGEDSMTVAEYEQLCLSDQWASDTTQTGESIADGASGNTPDNAEIENYARKTAKKKNTAHNRKKKRKDSHRLSVSSFVEDTKNQQKPSKRRNSKMEKHDNITKEPDKKYTVDKHVMKTQPLNRDGSFDTGYTAKVADVRGYTGSKIQLPSLVFTAAGSALDEDFDKGQCLHHISYNMDGLKDSPPDKFNGSPLEINTPECPDFCRALERAQSVADSVDEYFDSSSLNVSESDFKESIENSVIKPEKKRDKSGGICDSNNSTTEKVTVSSERRGSKSKKSKRKLSAPHCIQALDEMSKQDAQNCNFLQDPSATQESVKPRRRSLSDNPIVTFYFKVCKKLGILPLRKVIQQFGRAHMTFKNLTLTSRDMKALCLTLQRETFASSLDFTGNFIQAKELGYVISVLNRLHTIFQVSLCNNSLHSQGIADISRFLLTNDFLTRLDLSGNKLTDKDAPHITAILQKNTTLKTLLLNHNEFREEGGILIGQALAENTTLEDIDLSWNHLRRCGAIGIATGLQQNTALRAVNLAWNGFGFEGCVAIGDMMCSNTTITELDLAYNRIGPQALLEVLRGVAGNKTLRILKLGYNPVTASFSSFILLVVQKHRECALENIDLAGVVVDKEFVSMLEEIQKDRFFIVNYEVSLPVKKMSREEMREKIGLPSAYNVDPLRMLYLLKEKMRASDFFYKINKDNDDGLQRDELYELFDEAGLPVTTSVIDKIMEFMDTNGDGTIDLGEFLQGDKRIKNMSRKQLKDEQERRNKDGNFTKYSRTFQKAHADPLSIALKVEPTAQPVRQPNRRMSKHESDEDNNHLKIP